MSAELRRYTYIIDGIRIEELVFAELFQWTNSVLAAAYWHFYWHNRPGACLYLDNQREELTPERIVLIPPHTPFSSTMDPIDPQGVPIGSLYAHFRLGMPYDQRASTLLSLEVTDDVLKDLERLGDKLCEGRPLVVGLEFLFLKILNDTLIKVPQNTWPAPISDVRLKHALQFMRENLDRPLSLNEIADVAGAGISTLTRLFSKEIGQSPYQHHLELRLKRACDLLHYEDASVEKVAEECGFVDRTHFSKVFKRKFKQTPVHYRLSRRGTPTNQ